MGLHDSILLFLILFALYFGVQVLAAVITVIYYLATKKKAKKRNHKAAVLITLIPTYLAAVFFTLLFFVPYKYNDYLVYGKNYKTVEKIYGEFDDVNIETDGSGSVEYYVDNIDIFSYVPGRYIMEFDENGKIYDMYYTGFPGG